MDQKWIAKRSSQKKGRLKDYKFKTMVEPRVNEIIRSMLDMKIIMNK